MNYSGISVSELEVLIAKKRNQLGNLVYERDSKKEGVTYNAGDGKVGYYTLGNRLGIDNEIVALREEISNLENQLRNLNKINLNKEINNNKEQAKNQKNEVEWRDVQIDEEWALQSHYTQVAIMDKEIVKLEGKINRETNPIQKSKLQNRQMKLEEEVEQLKRYSQSDIIMFAKDRKAAYLNAKQRYSKLSKLEQLKIKLSGKELNWEKIKDNQDITTMELEGMYQGRSR